jgi:hypothetical protein
MFPGLILTSIATDLKNNNEVCGNYVNMKTVVEPTPEISCISKIPQDSTISKVILIHAN